MSVSFSEDVLFLREHVETLVLGEVEGPQVAVVPGYQGRVMTSGTGGGRASMGWINRRVVAARERQPQIQVYGGEDRLWLGPEGGQYGLYFSPGAPFTFEHWQTPACIDTEGFEVTGLSAREAAFAHRARLVNHRGTTFDLGMERVVRMLDGADVARAFGAALPQGVEWVAYESENRIINLGDAAWRREEGLVSIWILGMYPPSAGTTIVVPYEAGAVEALGPVVNDAYFGRIGEERMRVAEGCIFLRGDGQSRGKIGLGPRRAKATLGSHDMLAGVLTVVAYDRPSDTEDYVNSMWEMQAAPYCGDVVNAYNDGPPMPGAAPLGPFYELETSSPARALAPGEALTHVHRTVHATGDRDALDAFARATLGVGLGAVAAAFA